jgi:undecaprenyl diphosphate synthase
MAEAMLHLPRHLAVIMDGNGRWAQRRGLPRSEGHKAGTETAKSLVTSCRELGIAHLTLYTFSRENWGRPADEVSFLFDLLVRFLNNELSLLMDQDVKLLVLGEIAEFPFAVRQVLKHVMKKTSRNGAMILNLALNYSGREEILRACRRLIAQGVRPEAVTEERFSAELYTQGQPDPDLVVRTSGELRIRRALAGFRQGRVAKGPGRLCRPPAPLRPDRGPGRVRGLLKASRARAGLMRSRCPRSHPAV